MQIVEIFESLQGEGKYAGARQIFVRGAGCPVGCDYCDTDFSPRDSFTVNRAVYKNPVSAEELVRLLTSEFRPELYHSVSFTGGEPLIYSDELRQISPLLRERGVRLFLETSGYRPEELPEIGSYFDYISLDIKTVFAPFEEHLRRLLHAVRSMGHPGLYLKLVLRQGETDTVPLVAAYMKSAGINELWLQPVDNVFNLSEISSLQNILASHGISAYFIPQLHKILNIR